MLTRQMMRQANLYAQQHAPAAGRYYPLGGIQGAYGSARQANLRRYEEILAGYRQRYTDVMQGLEGRGAQQREDILMRGRTAQSTALQDAIGRGLAGTTVLPTMRAGAQQRTEGELRRLEEGLRAERLGYMSQLRGDELRFMERREDMYPNVPQYMALQQAQGRYGGAAQQSYQARPRSRLRAAYRPRRRTRRRSRPRQRQLWWKRQGYWSNMRSQYV